MEYEKIDKKAVVGWRIANAITMFIVAIFVVPAMIIVAGTVTIGWIVMASLVVGIAVLVFLLVVVLAFPAIEYRQWRYMVTEDKVEIRHGIFWVKTSVIPIIRIQHITVAQGPIYKGLGLYKVKISLASGEFEIEGLRKETADIISENLKASIYSRLNAEEASL